MEILPRGQISQNGRIRTHHVFVGSLTLRPKKCGTYVTFTRHRTNFRPAEKFDRTLCSFLYFHFVHTEISTARRLIFRTVKMVPWEKNTQIREFSTGEIRPLLRVKVALRATNSSLLAELGVPVAATFRYKMTVYFISLVQSATGHWDWSKDPA